jgi:hypothetical protein
MKYKIKDADGNVTNTIKASAEFVEANFEHYELYVEPTVEAPTVAEEARQWRDMELSASDFIVPLSDHPQRAAYITYRESLRAWPANAENFPDTRPSLGD